MGEVGGLPTVCRVLTCGRGSCADVLIVTGVCDGTMESVSWLS
jgi:hypothetical protein